MNRLTDKQQVFIDYYCSNGYNASQAYKKAYPNCKAGYNKLSSRLMAKDGIRQAIAVRMAVKQAEIDYNYEIAIKALDAQIENLRPLADKHNIQAIQATTALLREKNDIAGLHKQEIKQTGDGLTINVGESPKEAKKPDIKLVKGV